MPGLLEVDTAVGGWPLQVFGEGGAGAPEHDAGLCEPWAALVLVVLRISAVVFEPTQARHRLPGRRGSAGPEAHSPAGLCVAHRSVPFSRFPGAHKRLLPF